MCDRVRLALAEAHLADGETELATEVALRAVAAALLPRSVPTGC